MDHPVVRLAEPRVVRLVATARLRDPVLHLLLRDPALGERDGAVLERMVTELAEIEGATSGRLTLEAAAATLFPRGRPHADFVNAAFAYARPREPNRFSPAGRGAWGGAMGEPRRRVRRPARGRGASTASIRIRRSVIRLATRSPERRG